MDCGTISHLIARAGCHLNNTTVDESLGFVGLVIIGVGGLALMVKALIEGWNAPSTKRPDQPDAGPGSE